MNFQPDIQSQELSESQINALISDPNAQVSTTIQHHLVSIGPRVLPCLTQADCERFLRVSGHDVQPYYLEQSPHHRILARMVNNMTGIYTHRKKNRNVPQLKRLAKILEDVRGG